MMVKAIGQVMTKIAMHLVANMMIAIQKRMSSVPSAKYIYVSFVVVIASKNFIYWI